MKITKIIYITRHGHRGPLTPMTNSPWKSILGLLTPKGIKVLYQKGNDFRNQHIEFFNQLEWSKQVMAISSNMNRTISTAYCLLRAFQGETQGEDTLANKAAYLAQFGFKNNSIINDMVFKGYAEAFVKGTTKYYNALNEMHRNKKTHKEDFAKCQALVLKLHSIDIDKIDFIDIFHISDQLFCSKQNDIPLVEEDEKILSVLNFMHYFLLFDLMFADEMIRKFTNHFFFKSIINILGSKTEKKLFFYSSHDANILSALVTLGLNPKEVPFYASNLVIYQYENNQIEVKYNSDAINEKILGVKGPANAELLIEKLKKGMFASDEEYFLKSEEPTMKERYVAEHSQLI